MMCGYPFFHPPQNGPGPLGAMDGDDDDDDGAPPHIDALMAGQEATSGAVGNVGGGR